MASVPLTDRGRRTRQRIVEETGRQILAAGIGGTSLDDIRAATLTSKSQLFHYFPGGKAELLLEVSSWEGAQLLAAQEPEIHDLGSWESWQRWRDGLVRYYIGLGRWACPIGSLTMQAAMTDPVLERHLAVVLAEWRSLLAAGVRRMQAAGRLDEGADPERLAAAVQAAIQGGLLLSQPERSGWPLQAALDSVLEILRRDAPTRAA